MCYLRFQGKRVSSKTNKLALLCDPEIGGSIFLRNRSEEGWSSDNIINYYPGDARF
jgi:hypothetical protein